MPTDGSKQNSRNSTLLTRVSQRARHHPTVARRTPSTSNTRVCAQSQPRWHRGTPGIHFALRRNSTPPPAFIFLENPPPIKRFPWLGREVSPEIDVSRDCQLCAMATSFFQASGEIWSSKTAIPKGWDHFRPIPPESRHCPSVPGEMRSVSLRRPRGIPRSFASSKQLIIYLAITANVAQKTGRGKKPDVPCFSPQLLSLPFPSQGHLS